MLSGWLSKSTAPLVCIRAGSSRKRSGIQKVCKKPFVIDIVGASGFSLGCFLFSLYLLSFSSLPRRHRGHAIRDIDVLRTAAWAATATRMPKMITRPQFLETFLSLCSVAPVEAMRIGAFLSWRSKARHVRSRLFHSGGHKFSQWGKIRTDKLCITRMSMRCAAKESKNE